MEPTNHPFRKEHDLPNPYDYVPAVNLPGCKLCFKMGLDLIYSPPQRRRRILQGSRRRLVSTIDRKKNKKGKILISTQLFWVLKWSDHSLHTIYTHTKETIYTIYIYINIYHIFLSKYKRRTWFNMLFHTKLSHAGLTGRCFSRLTPQNNPKNRLFFTVKESPFNQIQCERMPKRKVCHDA